MCASAAMMRLRAGKHQRIGREPGRQLARPRSRARRSRRAGAPCWADRGRPPRRPAPRPSARRPRSAPAWAALSTPSAIPLTTVTPAAASPRPSARATSRPSGDARRVPTTATARGPCSRSAPTSPSAGRSRRHEEHRRRVVEVAQRARGRPRRGDTAARSPERATASRSASTSRRSNSSRDRAGARAPQPGDELLLRQREDLAQPPPLVAGDLDRPGQPRDEPGPRAGTARRPGRAPLTARHAAIRRAASASWRYPSAATTCSRANLVAGREVGDRPRQAQRAIAAARAEVAAAVGVQQRALDVGARAGRGGAAAVRPCARCTSRPSRRGARAGARARRSRARARSPTTPSGSCARRSASGRWTWTRRSMRSSSGPLSRRAWRARSASLQRQRRDGA